MVATGDQNLPLVPPLARTLPDRIAQYHTANYRGPAMLPTGAVLVVGSAQSGCQIAEDLLAAGRSLSLQALARAGATLVGRPVAVGGERVTFDDSAAANVAAGDAFATRMRAMVDDLIARRGLDAPPAEPDPTDAPVELDPPAALDLGAEDIANVVWCTGFTGDFTWVDPALLDADGKPRRRDAAAVAPGVWYVG